MNGNKIKKVRKNHLDQAVKFIFDLNSNFENNSQYFFKAKDYCSKYLNHINITEKYFKKYNKTLLSNINLNTFYLNLKSDFSLQKKKILKKKNFLVMIK